MWLGMKTTKTLPRAAPTYSQDVGVSVSLGLTLLVMIIVIVRIRRDSVKKDRKVPQRCAPREDLHKIVVGNEDKEKYRIEDGTGMRVGLATGLSLRRLTHHDYRDEEASREGATRNENRR